ncbi:hypothetical protein EYF80_005819 [Liparis tanakae]|uniref:Uncharacterized protein n=1 Tax=Liparis tanakae TaxID=230148 RepID=A0A4Z2J2K3_9TELE|nr:hypothetical protein EYF80_005819 [Liparis tanakae]
MLQGIARARALAAVWWVYHPPHLNLLLSLPRVLVQPLRCLRWAPSGPAGLETEHTVVVGRATTELWDVTLHLRIHDDLITRPAVLGRDAATKSS